MTIKRVYEPIWIVSCDGCGRVATGFNQDYVEGMELAFSINEEEDAANAAMEAKWDSEGGLDLCRRCDSRLYALAMWLSGERWPKEWVL